MTCSRDLPADEHGGASEPTDQPDDDTHPEPSAPQEDPVDQGDPDRDQRDDQRDDTGVHPEVLRDGDRAVPAQEQQAADHGGRAPLPRGGAAPPVADPAPAHEDRAGQEEPDGGADERRDRLVGPVDRQVGVPQKKYTTPSPVQIRAALGELGSDIRPGYGWKAVR